MTIEEAIDVLENCCCTDEILYDAMSIAISSLRAQNEPLTLEGLKKMDGEPVWIDEHEEWALVNKEGGYCITHDGDKHYFNSYGTLRNEYGNTWRARRNKPE